MSDTTATASEVLTPEQEQPKGVIAQETVDRILLLWPKLTLTEKQRFAVVIKASREYHITHPIQTYKPQKKQKLFHLAMQKIRAIFGGNQSGKTYAGAMEASMYFTGEYPDWYPAELRFKGPTRGRILVKDFPKGVAEVLEPALIRSIPQRCIKQIRRNSQGYITKIVGMSGSTIDIVTHDMDTQSLEGWQGHWLWCDEPPPRDKWIASMRGLIRLSGRAFITCTPLEEPWLYDEVCVNPECFVEYIDIYDNEYLKPEEIAKFAAMLNEDEKEARLHGKFMHLSGLTYKEFNAGTHVKNISLADFLMMSATWPKWQVVDPHLRRPFAIAYYAVDPMGRHWKYNEWPGEMFHKMRTSTLTPKDYQALFLELEVRQKIHRRIMDGRFCKQPQGSGGESLLEIFDNLGVNFEPSYITTTLGQTDPGHLKLKDALRSSPVTGEPNFFVLAHCRNSIYSFQHNTWENYRDETKGVREKQAEYAKDFLDLDRYYLMDEPAYLEPVNINHHQSKWVEEREAEMAEHPGTYGSMQEF